MQIAHLLSGNGKTGGWDLLRTVEHHKDGLLNETMDQRALRSPDPQRCLPGCPRRCALAAHVDEFAVEPILVEVHASLDGWAVHEQTDLPVHSNVPQESRVFPPTQGLVDENVALREPERGLRDHPVLDALQNPCSHADHNHVLASSQIIDNPLQPRPLILADAKGKGNLRRKC